MACNEEINEPTFNPNFEFGRWLSSALPGEEVVISGMSGRLPESNNIKEFCDHLFKKEEMVSGDDRRWKLDHPEIPQRTAKIPVIDKFDAGNFGLHFRQADNMDPMMRMLLETAVEAIMDAGINPAELEGTKTGVFSSTCWTEEEMEAYIKTEEPQEFPLTGYLRSLFSHRISYYLKLKGPAFNADTACSSSLNALDAAFRAIRSGLCENAIVGCTNLLLHPGIALQFFRLGVLSSDGVCRVFDQDANGYVRGETIACLFLQKAKNSRRIYAQIVNCKSNSDGFKQQGITFPSTVAQQQLMSEIYEESNIHPSELNFLEAHSTGTQVGDPQEVEAIDTAIAKKRQKTLLVGSVKSSIGHTEPCSGVCSIIKVLLAMETGIITPNINLHRIKEGMKGIEEGRMQVVTKLTELEGENSIVGINNFGFGGNNCHVILRRHKETKMEHLPKNDTEILVCISGRTKEAVSEILEGLNSKNLNMQYVGLLHQIYKINTKNHLYRGYTIVSKMSSRKPSVKLLPTQPSHLYIFFGQFTQNYKTLGLCLLNFPALESTIIRINKILNQKNAPTFEELLKNIAQSQEDILASICVQLALVDLLNQIEIYPSAVFGDSYSKIIRAYHYNALSLEEVISAAFKISQLDLKHDFRFQTEITNFAQIHQLELRRDLNHDVLTQTSKNTFILNVSDTHLNTTDTMIVDNGSVSILDVLGRLYECGHLPQLQKLYPKIEFPVSRGTPMISPSIRWNHKKPWYTFKFTDREAVEIEQKEFNISYFNEKYKFMSGHVIDDRNFFPAAQYLELVWKTLTQSRRLLEADTSVLFTNCRFKRAVILPKNGFLSLTVTLEKGTGNFEIIEKNSIIVSGNVQLCANANPHQTDPKDIDFDKEDKSEILEKDEIYRDLYLRGYNYNGVFKGIEKFHVGASVGLLKWDQNWVTFIDTMFQIKLLQSDTRLLHVPIGIKQMTINPAKHMEYAEKLYRNDSLFSVHLLADGEIIKSGGIEIRGLQSRSISKKRQRLEPVLETYEFVPNCCTLKLEEAVRVNTQIILENTLEIRFKAVEIIDEDTNLKLENIMPLMCQALDDVPLIVPDLTISSKKVFEETPGVKVENMTLTPESNFLLIVGTDLLQRLNTLKQLLNSLNEKGFILSRESVDFVSTNIKDLEIVTEYETPYEKLILLKKCIHYSNTRFIKVDSSSFEWLPILQDSIKKDSNVVAYSVGNQPEGLLGLVNCVRQEPSGNRLKGFLIIDEMEKFDPKMKFFQDQIKKDLAINVCKNKTWGTYRHLPLKTPPEKECEHVFANITAKGDLSSLKWLEGQLKQNTPLPKNKIYISTSYSALNFKDIMVASGRVNIETLGTNRMALQCPIGFEFSGKDLSGRRVAGMTTTGGLSSGVVGDKTFLWEIPDCWNLEDGATIPVVYATVLYALTMVKDLKRGSSILIHSGTGGVGLAALNVCLHYDCEIFVTVGTQEKREYLRKHYPQIPERHIGNSRDTSFEDMIKNETKGRGVDIVLNSLSEDKLLASVRCLARGGRFLEIGRFDLSNDTTLNLLLLEKDISYHGVMLDRIFLNFESMKKKVLKAVYDGIRDGYIKPLPRVVFNMKELEPACRHMLTGKHIGKVLIKIRDEEANKTSQAETKLFKATPRFNCDIRYSYIVIGGLGGVGLELTDWLVLRGARKVILVTRSGIQNGYQTQRMRIWKSYGADIQLFTEDITKRKGCQNLIENAKELGSVDAIFNLAAVLNDALLENQTEESFLDTCRPKAQTTIHLDQLSRELCPNLRYFVIFSSVSCGRGNAGQSNYGMANSVMERICEKRRDDGLPATAIQWGAIGDVGLVAKLQKENKELVIGGTLQQRISSCLDVLDILLKQDHPIVSSMLVAEKLNRTYGTDSAVDAVAHILGIKDIKTVSQHATLPELGMDSMMGTEIMLLLEKDFEIFITPTELRNLTFTSLFEIEKKKMATNSNHVVETTENIDDVDNLFQFIPSSKDSHLKLIKLKSQIQDNENAKTLFLFPGIEGVLKVLEPFAQQLKSHVIGVQYNYMNPEDTIQEMTKNIVNHIESEIFQEKTFHFVGYSFGTVIATEIAYLLEEKGYTGKIILIDGSPTAASATVNEYLPSQDEAEFQTLLIYRILSLMTPLDTAYQAKDKFIKCKNLKERIDLGLTLIPKEFKDEHKPEKQAVIALYKRIKAMTKYKIPQKKLKSTVYLFKASYTTIKDEHNRQLSEMCENLVHINTIEGGHVTMLNKPQLVDSVNNICL